jgi:ribonuclease R
VVEITAITDDGEGLAYPVDTSKKTSAEILVTPDHRHASGRSFAVGDQILVRLVLVAPLQYNAQIIRKLSRHRRQVFGHVIKARGGYELESIDRNARANIALMPPRDKLPFVAGDMVEAEMLKPPHLSKTKAKTKTIAKVIRNLGAADDEGAFAVLAIAEFELRHTFPAEVIKAARSAKNPTLGQREDLRNTPLVTIDGADAKDFDDAVFAEPCGDGGYRMVVAIADVASYVAPDSALDREAQLRGNSVYLPSLVIPMLPEELSNGLCSLVPGEDRACLAVEMFIDANGNKTSHRFFRAMMRSHGRLTYDAVEEYRLKITPDPIVGLNSVHLDCLIAAYELRARIRTERGALDLDLPEKRVVFNDENQAIAISKSRQSISQKLIEEFMILANVAAAETLEGAKAQCVFRAHEPPDPAKIDSLRDVTKALDIKFPKGQVIRPHHFNALLEAAKKLQDEAAIQLLNETILRCQSQADYRITNPGHFGLALRRYAHFTSPIRRYADLMVHRSLINHINAGSIPLPPQEVAADIAQAVSDTERKAVAAERKTLDRYATKLMEEQAGAIIEGRVVTVTGFGAFVQLGDSGVEGLLLLKHLPDDYYDIDTAAATITGRELGVKIRIGDTVSVMILSVAPLKASILLGWADGGQLAPRRKKTGKKGGNKGAKKGGRRYRRRK